MKKRTLSLLLALALCLGLLVLPAGAAEFTRSKTYTPGQFTDVADSAWYAVSVKDCFELGLMSGNSATTFNPGGLFTIAEAATIAGRMHNLYVGGNGILPVVAGPWYQGAVDYCVKNGIFAADEFDSYARNATRSEMAGIMARALPDSAWAAMNSVTALPDVNQATDYADAIFKLYDAGVFTGSDDYGMFQPYANITRAEVAAIVARCADQSQRKTLSLKPLSQREAPVITGGYNDSDIKMSYGRLKFQDPDTKKYGYLDGNGNAVIPAIYDSVWDCFEDGYAGVKLNGKWGLVDPSGQVTVPIEYGGINIDWADGADYAVVSNGRVVTPATYSKKPERLGDGLYRVYNRNYGMVNSAGQEIIPCQYNKVDYNGLYCICSTKGTYNVYNTSGQLLNTYSCDGFKHAKNSPLFAVKDGNKWALATVDGKVTEALYDDIELEENCNLAAIEIGELVGFAGASGVVLEPIKYRSYNGGYAIAGDYAVIRADEDGSLVIVATTGPVNTIDGKYASHLRGLVTMPDGYHVIVMGDDSDNLFLLNSNWQYVGIINNQDVEIDSGYIVQEDDIYWTSTNRYKYYFAEAGRTYGPIYGLGQPSKNRYLFKYYDEETEEGKYIPRTAEAIKSGEAYDTAEDAKAAYYESAAGLKELKEIEDARTYTIGNNDAGKPCVYYGSDETEWTPVIETYKNNFYYDEIKNIGEGYYACRFNTTWYLVHAD